MHSCRIVITKIVVMLLCGSGIVHYAGAPCFAEPVTEHITLVSVDMDEDLWNQLRHTAPSPNIFFTPCYAPAPESPYEYLPATVKVDGVIMENVGVRAKGTFGSVNPARPSLKIKFDKFVDGQLLAGDVEGTFMGVMSLFAP